MKIHEYQAKNILREYNVLVPRGEVAASPLDFCKSLKEIKIFSL